MRKETRLNLRITDEFRQQIEHLADYHGLSMSSYVHSLLVKAVRRELGELPAGTTIKAVRAPVVMKIEPGNRRDAQRMIDEADIARPKKRKAG